MKCLCSINAHHINIILFHSTRYILSLLLHHQFFQCWVLIPACIHLPTICACSYPYLAILELYAMVRILFFSLHSLSVLIRSLFAQIFVAIQFNMDVRCIAWCDTLNMLPHSFSSTTTAAAAAHCDAAQRIAYMQSHTAHCRFSC